MDDDLKRQLDDIRAWLKGIAHLLQFIAILLVFSLVFALSEYYGWGWNGLFS